VSKAEIAGLGAHGRPGLAAVTLAMATLLDRRDAVVQHPWAAGQLMRALDVLRKREVRAGRLAAVRQMTPAGSD
jgi:hypothetical protein